MDHLRLAAFLALSPALIDRRKMTLFLIGWRVFVRYPRTASI
jgi:hypothetical protein